ncbi:hypothetical protein [Limimaricola soesokkakensis]|uniref:hypothetical protein n=1 Tax=Limimaricola soesokkakensis TaxID=1343159 RepID=UPI0010562886|nr:hypothetical protein [Limimaricola soesokkakensis]
MKRTFAGLVFTFLIAVVPWDYVRNAEFADVENYVSRIDILKTHGLDYYDYNKSIVGLLTFEYAWVRLLTFLARNNLDPQQILGILSAISAFLTHRFLSRYLGGIAAILILANPITIDLLVSQVRSALAFSIVLTAVQMQEGSLRRLLPYILFAVAPFIHTGMILVIFVYFLSVWLSRRRSSTLLNSAFLTAGLGLLSGLVISTTVVDIAQAMGDRRNFSDTETKSLSYMFFWFLWAALLVIQASARSTRTWYYHFSLYICIAVWVMESSGIASFRFIALSIPIIALSSIHLHKRARIIAWVAMLFYNFLLYYYWTL